MTAIANGSPNFDRRQDHDPEITHPRLIVLHYTGMTSCAAARARLCDPGAKVSAHFLISETGQVDQLVAEEDRAWHAGISSWKGQDDVNTRSIGIEIANSGHEWGYPAFPGEQIDAVIALTRTLAERYDMPPTAIVGHSDIAPERKEDPGEKFPWDRLAMAGLAIGTFQGGFDASGHDQISTSEAVHRLADIGYIVPVGGPAAAILAFQRRFCPQALGKGLDPMTRAAIEWVATRFMAA